MNKDALINMLYAMRSQIDAALSLLEAEEEQEAPPGCSQCGGELLAVPAMGHPERKRCKECGHIEEVSG